MAVWIKYESNLLIDEAGYQFTENITHKRFEPSMNSNSLWTIWVIDKYQ